MLVLFCLGELQGLLVQHIFISHMVLEFLYNVVEDRFQSVCAFFAFIDNASVHMGVIMYASNVLEVLATFRLCKYDRDNMPSTVIFGVCKVLIFVQRWQNFVRINHIDVNFRGI